MRALLQRVSSARVLVKDALVAEIGAGLLILLGVGQGDSEQHASSLAEKIANLRIFEDQAGKFNLSLLEVRGEALVVSQFTLFADSRKGRRPSFTSAAAPAIAAPLVAYFTRCLADRGIACQSGVFGEHMSVQLTNDGPVTIWLTSGE
jgi:D-aminoacyl-tRNA deacylase